MKCAKSSVISNINSAFEVFSPKSMIRFFEFNDVGWNISNACVRDMYSYLDGLQKDLMWTYKRKSSIATYVEMKEGKSCRKCRKWILIISTNSSNETYGNVFIIRTWCFCNDRDSYQSVMLTVLDASGNYAGGLFYGQHLRPANPDQCYMLNDELDSVLKGDIEKSMNTSKIVPFFVHLINAKYTTHIDELVNFNFLTRSMASIIITTFSETRHHPNGLHARVMFIRWSCSNHVIHILVARCPGAPWYRARWNKSTLPEL